MTIGTLLAFLRGGGGRCLPKRRAIPGAGTPLLERLVNAGREPP